MRMMAIRGVWTTNTVAFLIGVGMYSSFILLPELVQEPASTGYGFGASVTAAGLFLLPVDDRDRRRRPDGGRARAPHRLARVADRRRRCSRSPATCCSSSTAARQWEIYVAAGLLGIGIGLSFSAMANLIVQNVRQEQTGVATGMNAVTRTLGGAFGGQLAATLLASNLGAGGIPTSSGFTLSFLMCLIALAGALGFALSVPRRSANDLAPEVARAAAGPPRRARAHRRLTPLTIRPSREVAERSGPARGRGHGPGDGGGSEPVADVVERGVESARARRDRAGARAESRRRPRGCRGPRRGG